MNPVSLTRSRPVASSSASVQAFRPPAKPKKFLIDFKGGSGKFHKTEISSTEDLRCILRTVKAIGLQEAYESSGNPIDGCDILRSLDSLDSGKRYTVYRSRW